MLVWVFYLPWGQRCHENRFSHHSCSTSSPGHGWNIQENNPSYRALGQGRGVRENRMGISQSFKFDSKTEVRFRDQKGKHIFYSTWVLAVVFNATFYCNWQSMWQLRESIITKRKVQLLLKLRHIQYCPKITNITQLHWYMTCK